MQLAVTLIKHYEIVHKDVPMPDDAAALEELKPYACKFCNEFASKTFQALKSHWMFMHKELRVDSDEKETHYCEECGKGFERLGTLTQHVQNVHRERSKIKLVN